MNFSKKGDLKMKVKKTSRKNKLNTFTELTGYDYYLGLDYSQTGYSLSRLTGKMQEPEIVRGSNRVEEIQEEIKKLKGKKILTIEETTSTHWLYVELKDYVEKIVVCDPYRNSLLGEGPKDDDIDAGKLSILLRGGFLKEVYHTDKLEEYYMIRKLISSYEDLIKRGVRIKNQQSSIYRSMGKSYKKKEYLGNNSTVNFIERQQNRSIKQYEEQRKEYIEEFEKLRKKIPVIEYMCKVSGIETISAVKIYGIVIEARRFSTKYKYWGYCGLVKHQKFSGNRNYGKRKTRYSRVLKSVYKTAALASIRSKSDIGEYYKELLTRGISEDKARNQISRYIAKVTLAIMKYETEYIPYLWRKPIAA